MVFSPLAPFVVACLAVSLCTHARADTDARDLGVAGHANATESFNATLPSPYVRHLAKNTQGNAKVTANSGATATSKPMPATESKPKPKPKPATETKLKPVTKPKPATKPTAPSIGAMCPIKPRKVTKNANAVSRELTPGDGCEVTQNWILAQTWMPSFRAWNHCATCTAAEIQHWNSHLTLHGLWEETGPVNANLGPTFPGNSVLNRIPGFRRDWPSVQEFSRTDPKTKQTASFRANLPQHEWNSHGRYTGLSPTGYVKAALRFHQFLSTPAILATNPAPTEVSKADLKASIGHDVCLICAFDRNKQELDEVRTCLLVGEANLADDEIAKAEETHRAVWARTQAHGSAPTDPVVQPYRQCSSTCNKETEYYGECDANIPITVRSLS